VLAIQDGEQIFICSASFQQPESGLDYQVAQPAVRRPRNCSRLTKPPQAEIDKLPEKLRRWLQIERPFEFRPVQAYNPLRPVASEPVRQIWMRAVGKLPDDERIAPLPAGVHLRLLAARHEHHAARFRRSCAATSSWRASITRSGSTARCVSTTGCSTASTASSFGRARLRARQSLHAFGVLVASTAKRAHTARASAVAVFWSRCRRVLPAWPAPRSMTRGIERAVDRHCTTCRRN
jgi:acyl-CoA thioesterase II